MNEKNKLTSLYSLFTVLQTQVNYQELKPRATNDNVDPGLRDRLNAISAIITENLDNIYNWIDRVTDTLADKLEIKNGSEKSHYVIMKTGARVHVNELLIDAEPYLNRSANQYFVYQLCTAKNLCVILSFVYTLAEELEDEKLKEMILSECPIKLEECKGPIDRNSIISKITIYLNEQ